MPIDKTAKQLIVEAVKNAEMSDNLVAAVEKYIGNDESVRLIDCRYEDYSKDKLGFSAAYMKLEITLQKSDAGEPRPVNFFVKSRLDSFAELADAVGEEGLFLKESHFYSTIVPLFEKNCKTERWHATCYLANENVIIMEDLRSQGYRLFGQMADDMMGIKGALSALARLHSSSIIAEDCLNHNSEKASTLKELYPGLLDDQLFEQGILSTWCSTGVDLACVIAGKLNYDSVKIRRSYERMPILAKPSKIHRNVFCHGDLWGNNIMFRDKSPAVRECILLDFQVNRYAPLAIDLLQFLHINTSRIFREKHAKDLVKFYRCALEETIRSNDSSAKIPEVKDILAAMEDLRLVGLFLAVIYLPMTLMGPEAIAECTKDVDSFWNFMFHSRTEQTLAHMEINETYKNRIYEAVIELAEYIDVLSEAKS